MDIFNSFESKDVVMIAAIILGPILSVHIQKIIEKLREKRNNRNNIFQTLMSTRGARLSFQHVQSLNMIDIEFYGRKIFGIRIQNSKEKAVTNAWKNYNDHLNSKYPEEQIDAWVRKGDELLVKLLFHMSRSLGYDFDEVQLKRDCYTPIAHGDMEYQINEIRKGLSEIISGKKPFPIFLTNLPLSTTENKNSNNK